jgi:hypothetical protein
MGLTIHFQGKLVSDEQYEKLITCAKDFAEENQMPWVPLNNENGSLLRYKDGDFYEYNGTIKGIVIQPGLNCEPFFLQFDKDLIIHQFCKTQYADISIHILLIDLLRQIESCFAELIVIDEGEYWETDDINLLQKHFDKNQSAIDKLSETLIPKSD